MTRSDRLFIRASSEELERWHGQAQAAGLTLSGYVRQLLEQDARLQSQGEPEVPEEDWQVTLARLAHA